MNPAVCKELKGETALLVKHKKLLLMFQNLWNERVELVKKLSNKQDVSKDLLRVNRAESRLIFLIESSELNQKTNLEKIRNQAPKELRKEYEQLVSFAMAWFSVIGTHKKFLEVERDVISIFIKDALARKRYFDSLNLTLLTYSQIIKMHDTEVIISKSIYDVSKKKISGLPSTALASFNYGLYRIVAATIFGAIIFSDSLPGGSLGEFILWSLHVNIAGTIISFADMKFDTANKIKTSVESMFYFLKPTL